MNQAFYVRKRKRLSVATSGTDLMWKNVLKKKGLAPSKSLSRDHVKLVEENKALRVELEPSKKHLLATSDISGICSAKQLDIAAISVGARTSPFAKATTGRN